MPFSIWIIFNAINCILKQIAKFRQKFVIVKKVPFARFFILILVSCIVFVLQATAFLSSSFT